MAYFNNLWGATVALEDDQAAASAVTDEEAAKVAENVEQDADIADAQQAENDAEQVEGIINASEEEVEQVEEVIKKDEEVLEDPTQVDETTVETQITESQEALNYAVIKLFDKSQLNKYGVSLESAETKEQKLRLACEGLKDFASNVWEKIKELFAKFITMLRKVAVKLGALFNRGSSRADAFIKQFTQQNKINSEPTAEDKSAIAEAFPIIFNGSYSGFKSLATTQAPIENFRKAMDAAKKLNGDQGFISKFLGMIVGLFVSAQKIDGVEVAMAFVTGKATIKYIDKTGKSGSYSVSNPSALGQNVGNLPSAKDLVVAATRIKQLADNYKTTTDTIFKALDNASKAINDVKAGKLKDAENFEAKAEARKDANFYYKVNTFAAFATIQSHSTAINGSLAVLAKISKFYGVKQ